MLIRMGCLLPAVMRGWLRGGPRAWAAPLGPVQGPRRSSLQHEGAGGHAAGVPFRGHPQRGASAAQDGQQAMHPVVGLGLAQPTLHAMHGLQGMGLVIDEDTKQLVFPLYEAAFGATAPLAAAGFAVPGLVQRIASGLSRPKRRQHPPKLVVRQASRGQKFSWPVF